MSTVIENGKLARPVVRDGAVLVCPHHDNAVRWAPGERFHHLFEDRFTRFGERVAVATDTESLSFAGLERRANQLARYLIGSGVKAGDRVGLLLNRSVWSYVAMLAVSKAGAAYVPLDRSFPEDRIRFIAEDSDLRLILTISDLESCLKGGAVAVVCLDRAAPVIGREDAGPVRPVSEVPPDGLCYIIYTSGSTGRPKGVAVNHSSICNFIRVAAEVYGFAPEDRVYQGMTIAFDFSVEEIWVPLFSGATLVPAPAEAVLLGPDLATFIRERKITALCCVPTLLATLGDDLPDLRFVLVSGEACPAQLVDRWHRRGRTFLNVYGPTEATVTATWTHLQPGRPVTIGRPLPTYSIVILDEAAGRALPVGEVGEIAIAGIGLAEGYVNRPDLTERAFVPDFLKVGNNPSHRLYRTGDLGRVTDEGEVEYLGRIDTQVKIRGYRIELAEIESVVMMVPGVAQAVVAVHETTPGMNELVAYYTCEPGGASLEQEGILEEIRTRLPSYMLPAFFEELPALPMLPSGKVDRKSLPPPMGPRHTAARRTGCAAPDNPDEETLSRILARMLGLEQVSVEDHFFDDLGANSLLMARFCAAVRAESEFAHIAMKDVYLHPTVRALARELRQSCPRDAGIETLEQPHHASNRSYYTCAVLQALLFFLYSTPFAVITLETFLWAAEVDDLRVAILRALAGTSGLFAATVFLPVILKWLVIGRWKPEKIPVWSLAYFRFWAIRALIRDNPMALFVGTPLYNLYLRMLGARIGRHAVIWCRAPVATDLFDVGSGAIIRKDSVLNCYRVGSGFVETGPIQIGDDAFVGEAAVLDIDTRVGDGAQLGHASSLQRGQAVPPGRRYHGSPAEETTSNYCRIPKRECGTVRRAAYGTTMIVLSLLVMPAAMIVVDNIFSTVIFDLEGTSAVLALPELIEEIAVFSLISYFGMIALGLVSVSVLPRILNLAIREGEVYPLYGVAYSLWRGVSALSNSVFFNVLFGDSAFIVHYLKWVGYRLDPYVQTGSNFGQTQKHDSPFLCQVGPGTVVSDGLSLINADVSSSSFRLSKAAIGGRNYLGNNIFYPHDSKTGENCLLATKVMVPIDGPVRTDVGLLGSPCFEIPRTVLRDRRCDSLANVSDFAQKLRKKTIYNCKSMELFLLAGWVRYLLVAALFVVAIRLHDSFGTVGLIPSIILLPVLSLAYSILLERVAFGFRRMKPHTCSIYDEYFWAIERFWKFGLTDRDPWFRLLAGTPYRTLVVGLLGAKVGEKVFDDGCAITEIPMVEIGDHCTLGEMSTLAGHSLEEGIFKSDRIEIGHGCSIGCNAFVHYGVKMGDTVTVSPDSFLMKGERPPTGSRWQGNPARMGHSARTANPLREDDRAERARRQDGRRGRIAALGISSAAAGIAIGAYWGLGGLRTDVGLGPLATVPIERLVAMLDRAKGEIGLVPAPTDPPATSPMASAGVSIRSMAAAPGPAVPAVDAPALQRMIARGDALLSARDVVSARQLYQLAASRGSPAAATMAGKTYDPFFLAEVNIPNLHGALADPAKAVEWYRKAITGGDSDAFNRLQRLNRELEE